MSLVERVRQVIEAHRLLQPGDRLIVAVSAGPDSVCLLRILHQLAPECDWSLVVAHLNHGLRGAAARADAAFVQKLAAELGLTYREQTVDIPGILAARGGSSQAVSRAERYRWLHAVAEAEQAQAILLAHHRGDQAETVLQHLLRGAGSGGLSGMRLVQAGDGCPLVRPLLLTDRQSILQHLQTIGQSFRVDQSNAEDHYQRNQLRFSTLPLLAEQNGAVELALSRTASLLAAEDQLLSQLAGDAYRGLRQDVAGELGLDSAELMRLPLALARRVLRLAFSELVPGGQDLTYDHVECALGLLTAAVGESCNWPRGVVCRRSYRQLLLVRPAGTIGDFQLELELPGITVLPHGLGEVRASLLDRPLQPLDFLDPNRVYCDLPAIWAVAPLAVRNWRPGDQFWPFGLSGRKKLQDFFVDAKIPQHQRRRVPLVVGEGEQVVWVAGMRLAEPFRVSACSRKLVCLEYGQTED